MILLCFFFSTLFFPNLYFMAARDFLSSFNKSFRFTNLPSIINASLYLCWFQQLQALHYYQFFSIRVFFGSLHRHWRFTGQQRRGEGHLLFHSTTSTYSQTFRHLFATLHVRWLSRIFNRNDCVYQTASQWDLQPYWVTIWLIGWWCNVCLLTWWFDSRFLLQHFDTGNRWIWIRIVYSPLY